METLEQFLDSLYQKYDNLTQDEFNSLIRNVGNTYKRVGDEDPYSELAYNIAKRCWRTKEVTFKQWKCMQAYVDRNIIRQYSRKFN